MFLFFFFIIIIIFKNQGRSDNELEQRFNGTRFTASLIYAKPWDIFEIQRDVQRDRNAETWHIVRQCEQPSATLPRRAECSRAQIAIMGFRFPSLKAIAIPQIVSHYRSNFLLSSTTRGSSIELRLRELAFTGRKIGQENRNETRFSWLSSLRQKKKDSRPD